jgi:hypothetical protein
VKLSAISTHKKTNTAAVTASGSNPFIFAPMFPTFWLVRNIHIRSCNDYDMNTASASQGKFLVIP